MRIQDIKTRPTAKIEIPVQLSRLRDMAYNLWWTWSPAARELFHRIDPDRWWHYRNPIELLIDLEPERWHLLQNDPEFIRDYRAVVEQFDAYIAPDAPTWFEERYPEYSGGPVAYFSSEFGWDECLQIYSGGLGVLSGDHSKAASDLGLPFVGVGLMYMHGYFRQTIDADGQQQHFYPEYDLHRVPLLPVLNAQGTDLRVSLELPGRTVQVAAWKADVGRVPVLLLDTDLPTNHPADRPITSILYVRGREMRLCQEIVLGLGGVAVLEALGLRPAVWHMNEGHSALLSLPRLRRSVRDEDLAPDEALRRIAADALFTTHTPVPAGNEIFDVGLVRKYFAGWSEQAGIDLDALLALGRAGTEDSYNLTALALRTSDHANGVSERHGGVARRMWSDMLGETGRTIDHVTNGVHVPTWIGPEIRLLLDEHLGPGFEERLLEPGFADAVERIPGEQVWAAHCAQKNRLDRLIRSQVRRQLARHGRSPDELRLLDRLFDPNVLLVGFARRFATYKRADLLLRDLPRLEAIANEADRPVQFLFAGKAHPADRPGQELIRTIWQASLSDGLRGRLLFLENYDMRIGRCMVQGVDVWLNNPRPPLEASGTSGMKAALNGGLNCSVLDGWWCEGYDAGHGWAIDGAEREGDGEEQDRRDVEALYQVLSQEIVPCYYRRSNGLPLEWIERMKRAIGRLAPRFSASRMVREYTERFYLGKDADRPA
jgi:starch phosphorylase